MSLPQPIDTERLAERFDHRVTLHGIAWEDYERLLAMRGESAGTRVTYLEGELELMTPSYDHESLKTTLGRLMTDPNRTQAVRALRTALRSR